MAGLSNGVNFTKKPSFVLLISICLVSGDEILESLFQEATLHWDPFEILALGPTRNQSREKLPTHRVTPLLRYPLAHCSRQGRLLGSLF